MTYIIIIISIFAAFYSGFYFGYIKREGKPPDGIPIVTEIIQGLEHAAETAKKEQPSKEDEKANSFFN